MTTDTIITIAALLSGSLGWLAFAKEYRAHGFTKGRLWAARRQLTRLTDRDERGRFVKREGKA